MNTKKYSFFTLFPLLAFLLPTGFSGCHDVKQDTPRVVSTVKENRDADGLNRAPSHIRYSKHARCRMGCRHIDEQEIIEILKTGDINYKKSELNNDDCHKKYAVEGYSREKQHLRVIFAPCREEVTVVTCIDLGVEWHCDCK